MIVISGVLVLVALVLLIIGVVGPDLTFVYASIGVSLVSLVFLVIGILQRRGEPAAATAGGDAAPAPAASGAPADAVTAVVPTQATGATSRRVADEPPVAETADEELETGGTVLVVEGRPRYHVDGCRYLSGKQAELVDVLDARDEGFTPCGVCKPDDALAAQAEILEDDLVEEDGVEEEVVEEDVPGVEVPAPTRTATRAVAATTARKAPAKKAAAKQASPKQAPARKAAASKAPAKAAAAPASEAPAAPARKAARTAPARTAVVKAPSKAAKAATAATPAAATAGKKAGSVVVIPDRGRYHKAECRFVRDVDGAEVLSKTAATRQGYAACGVCKP